MSELVVSPTLLRQLAADQQAAAEYAQAGTDALNGVDTDCWISHGTFSMASNIGFDTLEEIRIAAGTAFVNASNGLSEKLQAAAIAYQGVDEDMSTNMDTQMADG